MLSRGAGAFRLLLLALLSVGVIGMHTVGHTYDHSAWVGPASDTVTHAAATVADGMVSGVTDAVDPCGGHCGGATPVDAVRPGSDSDPVPVGTGLLIVCLAVLGGLGALALLASIFTRRYRTSVRAVRGHSSHSTGAAPPVVHRLSIHLVEVAVLRI